MIRRRLRFPHPPVVRRYVIGIAATPLVIYPSFFAIQSALEPSRVGSASQNSSQLVGDDWALIGLGVMILTYGVMTLIWCRWLKLKRRVKAADGCVCIKCGYDVSGLDAVGVCPECGTKYEHDSLRARWRWNRWFGVKVGEP